MGDESQRPEGRREEAPADPGLLERLRELEEQLDTRHPERQSHRFRIVAYGEISAVIQLVDRDDLLLKRMAGFRDEREVENYVRAVEAYVRALEARGVRVARTQTVPITTSRTGRVVHLVQPRLPDAWLGHHVLCHGEESEITGLLAAVYAAVLRCHRGNDPGTGTVLALDAQLSNWAWNPDPHTQARLTYFDVGTPLLRVGGVDRLDPQVVARPLPQPLRWAVVRFVVPSVVERYYDPGLAITDLIANFIMVGRADLLDWAVAFTNDWLRREAPDVGLRPIDVAAIRRYYARDARIWELVSGCRRLARFVDTRIRRRPYNFLIPGPVARR